MDYKELKSELFIDRAKCPSCGDQRNNELYNCKFTSDPIKKYLEDFYSKQGGVDFKYFNDEKFDLRECENCGLVYQKTILGDELMDRLYSNWIDPKFTLENIESSYSLTYYIDYTKLVFKLITFFNKKPSDLNFLDFGMGWGNWARIVGSFNVSSYGAELSEDRINHAKKYGVNIVDFTALQDDFFDYINTDQVFEHIPNPFEIIEKLSKSLKKGGILRISVPDGNRVKEALAIMDWDTEKGHPNSLNIVAPLEHINCYSTNSIVNMAKLVGLDWQNIDYYPQLEITQAPQSLKGKIKIAFLFPTDVMRYLYRNIKKLFGVVYIPQPKGTNLFFVKK